MRTWKVLIIDDSVITRKALRNIFEKYGVYEIHEASNGGEGMRQYEEVRPDIVTMDIMMGDFSGAELTKRIIAKYPLAKIIVVSANDQRDIVLEAIRNGAKNYITKPFAEEKVLTAVRNLLSAESS